MTIAKRVIQIVESLGMNKSEFARKLNLTPAYISKLDKNPETVPSDRTIADICREFGVSEVWLRTGEGEMFLPVPEDQQLIEVMCRMEMDQDDAFVHTLTAALKAYYHLNDADKAGVKNLLKETLEILRQKNNTSE